MDRISELLQHPESCLFDDETLIYYSNGKMIIRTHMGEDRDLVQLEGELDQRIPELVNTLLEDE